MRSIKIPGCNKTLGVTEQNKPKQFKTSNMKTKLLYISLMVIVIGIFSCEDDEPKTVPVVTTTAVTDITTVTAFGGGEITSNGNVVITASGLCWSSINTSPTIEDDTTLTTITMGSFTSSMKNLASSTKYYVRAYATNSVGTGYGEIIDFTTGNSAPTVTNVSITGIKEVDSTLIATYTFNDPENNTESGSTFKWYRADDNSGTGEVAIDGATGLSYVLKAGDENKYLRFGVTPKAATGTTAGVEVKSALVGPIVVKTTVTFIYNNVEVTYGIIVSSTGRKWLDRSLGASNVATSTTDYLAFGDLFQWGRLADGHQLMTRGVGTNVPVQSTTTTQATTNTPNDALFILGSDWRNPSNDNLWQGVSGLNNPCPKGWRIPTRQEWEAESLTSATVAFEKLKIVRNGGHRDNSTGDIFTTNRGIYWTSTVDPITGPTYAFDFSIGAGIGAISSNSRGSGRACRCIKD
jgi:hypothetical protein